MLLHAAENEAAGVEVNTKCALEAAHEAIWAFFKLWGLYESEAGVWWVFQHRAFEEALLIAHLLADGNGNGNGNGNGVAGMVTGYEGVCAKAKEDVARMLEIMDRNFRYGGSLEMHRTRKEVLKEAFERIAI
ncbi:hypothetical protein B0A55_11099 [Friedmanniomyces simplex]|uniref:Uncharacterized protein n=1 Tax=Friedmanniomyces simplex TaxID=329884 RepID=A0A4V5NBZ1_9PEZI|nr:hypothetical protein B0A55_11099 [Friedmanniomyces simplex]